MVKKCPTCAANNRDDANFCSSCGGSFVAPTPTPTPTPTPIPTYQPTVKPVPSVRVVQPGMGAPAMGVPPMGAPPMGAPPMRISPPGMCYYHPNLPAVYICNRCGRPICHDDAKMYGDLIICPQCYPMLPPPGYIAPAPPMAPPPAMPPPMPPPGPPPAPVYPPARATWGFLISLVAAILIIINAAALLSAGFYTMWTGIFPWIAFFGPFPPWVLFVIGIILGVIVALGATLMILGYGTIGAVVVFPAAVISLIFGGGFIAGFVLGVVGGILGMLGR